MTELDVSQLENRNTYFRGYYDLESRLIKLQKLVYGEVEMEHRYAYHPNDRLSSVEIIDLEGERNEMHFDEQGAPIS